MTVGAEWSTQTWLHGEKLVVCWTREATRAQEVGARGGNAGTKRHWDENCLGWQGERITEHGGIEAVD